jgi:hypothetical protein
MGKNGRSRDRDLPSGEHAPCLCESNKQSLPGIIAGWHIVGRCALSSQNYREFGGLGGRSSEFVS